MADKKNNKKSGFDAPAYGRVVRDDEELVRQPNGLLKLVKKTPKKKK